MAAYWQRPEKIFFQPVILVGFDRFEPFEFRHFFIAQDIKVYKTDRFGIKNIKPQ
jgi:hypothetical protein